VQEKEEIEELTGKLSSQQVENKLMHSVLENDKETIEKGKLISDSINQGLNSFTPDLIYQQLVKNYSMAKHIFGPSLLKLATGYNPDYIKKNINIPEFQRELRFRIEKNIEKLKEENLLEKDNEISEKGIELASLVMYFEELDKLIPIKDIVMPLFLAIEASSNVSSSGFFPIVGKASVIRIKCLVMSSFGNNSIDFLNVATRSVSFDARAEVMFFIKKVKSFVGSTIVFISDPKTISPTLSFS